jgi:sugar lactone lactonase YvrE
MDFRKLSRGTTVIGLATMLLVLAAWPIPGVGAQGPSEVQVLVEGAPLKSAGAVAFDSQGRLHVTEAMGHRIVVLDKETGQILETAARVPPWVYDLAFGPDGSLYWTSFSDGAVGRVEPDGTTSSQIVGPGTIPLAFSEDGRLFVGRTFMGNGLYELDPKLADPPRVVIEGHKWQSAMAWGPDGFLYAPLQFEDIGVRVDVGTGTMTKIIDGASNMQFDRQGRLYSSIRRLGVISVDTIIRVDMGTGTTELIAELPIGVKSLGFDSEGRLFVAHWGDGAVYEVLEGGQVRTVSPGGMVFPGGVAVLPRAAGGESVYVADGTNLREFDGATGEPRSNVFSFQVPGAPGAPMTVAADGANLLLSSWFGNAVQVYDPQVGQLLADMKDFKVPMNAIRFQGDYIVTELGSSSVVRAPDEDPSPDKRVTIAKELKVPLGLAKRDDDDLYVSDWASGEVLQLVKGGEFLAEPIAVATGLQFPEGLAVDPDGNLLVAETGTGRLLCIEMATGQVSTIVQGLEVGGQTPPENAPPCWQFTGVVVGPSGAIYVTGDVANVLYKITPPIVAHPTTLPVTGHATGSGLPVQLLALAGLVLIGTGLGFRQWVAATR